MSRPRGAYFIHTSKVDERISQGDINVPNYTCKRDGNGWRVAVG
ncbi:hypothetical protein QX204_26975 [Nocardia sp. PE-7]|nr:hypothetical protein [Nocardia sp. PE-7]WKG08652.1 hypothetical protein QX204_26975 [Nocardia sp. PE-7]